jgi:hypothetical protein
MTEFHQSPPAEDAPPAGSRAGASEWDFLNGVRGEQRPGAPDLSQLLLVLEGVRRVVPQELQEQFNALVRELLLTVRALIDWYLERLNRPPAEARVEDIPIE